MRLGRRKARDVSPATVSVTVTMTPAQQAALMVAADAEDSTLAEMVRSIPELLRLYHEARQWYAVAYMTTVGLLGPDYPTEGTDDERESPLVTAENLINAENEATVFLDLMSQVARKLAQPI